MVDKSGNEEMGMEINASEATFIVQYMRKGINGSCVSAISGNGGLDYKSSTD